MVNFRKITAALSGALMIGSSIALAAASTYPAPFVSGGNANVAIVYGSGSGVSVLDAVQAGNIQSNLQSYLGGSSTSSATTVTGGDSIKIEKSSTKFNLGKGSTDVIATSITDNGPGTGLPTLLADGKYVDNDNDEFDFTQKIELANLSLTMWEDGDYKDDVPTVGISISSGAYVMNYTLDMTDNPEWADLTNSDIVIMGKEYYVLSITNRTTLNLLDSANTATVTEGESVSVDVNGKTYEVSVAFIGSGEAKLNINGETTNTLAEAQTQKLSGGAYVGIKDIMYDSKTGSVSRVEFSIGTGKLVLQHGNDIELNDDSVSDLQAFFTNTAAGKLDKVVIEWKAQDDLFITPDSEVLMPGFGAVKLSMAGMYYPEEETISVKGASEYVYLDNFPMKGATADINILYRTVAGQFNGTGKDATHRLVTTSSTELIFDGDTDSYFVASYNDGSNAESYLVKATSFSEASSGAINKTKIQYAESDSWTSGEEVQWDGTADSVTIGSVELNINAINKDLKTVNITRGNAYVNFTTLFSAEGMMVYLPHEEANNTLSWGAINFSLAGETGHNATSFYLVFDEEDKSGNIGSGTDVTAVLGWNSATTAEPHVSDVLGESTTFLEVENTDVYRSFIYSDLATELLWDKSQDQYNLDVVYHGDESYGEIYVSAPDASISTGSTTTSATSLGEVLVKDSEVNSVSNKNLIVVGGSCINSVAAKLLGGAYCGASFTDATSVGSGQFLIQSFSDAYTTGKVALLVAGYDVADTQNAATYVTTQTVDTTAGKKYVGTSSTSAELVTTTDRKSVV